MHDPMTVAFEIPSIRALIPRISFEDKPPHIPMRHWNWTSRLGGFWYQWPSTYDHMLTVWHMDPELHGDEDSCGWFKRAKHGNQEVRARIRSEFSFKWDGDSGWFEKEEPPFSGIASSGQPKFSVSAICLDMIRTAAYYHFGSHRRASKFMKKHLYEILWFAENPIDSMHSSITMKYGFEKRDERIDSAVAVVYGWVLRAELPWYRHARWHFWHWKLQFHFFQKLKRRFFTKCVICGKHLKWDESAFGLYNGIAHGKCTDIKVSTNADLNKLLDKAIKVAKNEPGPGK